MDVERSSLCNCVVNFLLEENYLLTAFELLHELLEDGRDVHAIRLNHFFSDPSHFPPHHISRFNSLRLADPQSLLEEKEALEEKLALREYDLRLAKEDALKLGQELQKKAESTTPDESAPEKMYFTGSNPGVSLSNPQKVDRGKRETSFSDLGSLKENERRNLNFAVKEYLMLAGYRLTAMTFYEEVTDQNLDDWENSSGCVPDALRHYYYQYLSSTTEAAEEKLAMLRESESLTRENEKLKNDNASLLKNKDLAENQVMALTRSLEALRKDLKDKEILVQDLKQSLEHRRKEINSCRSEITSLKMLIEKSRSRDNLVGGEVEYLQPESIDSYREEIKSLRKEIEILKASQFITTESVEPTGQSENIQENVQAVDLLANISLQPPADLLSGVLESVGEESLVDQAFDKNNDSKTIPEDILVSSDKCSNGAIESVENVFKQDNETFSVSSSMAVKSECIDGELVPVKTGLEAIQILSDALPKIVPYVLINHREELLPLIMCAIERHPDSSTRDSLTHTLFNLIKRPDEQQRRIIMDACVSLAKNVGEMRTETELLPQCWEQINHMYEERRLLVAQSCGELAEYVRPEIRDSLILSIIQQLIEDTATVVREAAAHNLALLLPLFPSMDKYFKVEEMMFQLICDPAGIVVDTTIKELVHALISWGNKLDQILRKLLSHMLSSAQRCPPLSGVEGSVESHLHVLGERERWNVEVLLRLLVELLPFVYRKVIETCPFSSTTDDANRLLPTSLLEQYSRGQNEWPAFEWLHINCFPDLIRLASLLPLKEDSLRGRITEFLRAVPKQFGDDYLTHIMLPVFLVAVGDKADFSYFPSSVQERIKGLRPRNAVAERLALLCVLPILLAGVFGYSSKHEQLTEYLRNILVQNASQEGQPASHNVEIFNSVRFLCTYEEHHNMIFNILWEMVVSSDVILKISAANLLKVIVPYVDAKVASTHVVPALVTLGSDQNLGVKYASIAAFGAVAQHFKNDIIVDKIRVQMDAFLEDGSHEATIAVVRALVVAVPHTTERLKDYLLSKIFQFTSVAPSSTDVNRRRERSNAFCESIRALDATDLSATSVRDLLLPAIQNLLKDTDALDPAHKEALEIIVKERSGGAFDAISKAMGAHLGIASSVSSFANVSSFFGDGGILGKKENTDPIPSHVPVDSPNPVIPSPAEDTRFKRIMRGGFSDMLRGRSKSNEELPPTSH